MSDQQQWQPVAHADWTDTGMDDVTIFYRTDDHGRILDLEINHVGYSIDLGDLRLCERVDAPPLVQDVWMPAENNTFIQGEASPKGEGISCRKFGSMTEFSTTQYDDAPELQQLNVFVPGDYWLCRRVRAVQQE